MAQAAIAETIEQGSFVQLRGRPWLVEELRGDGTDLETISLSCIADDAQGERAEVLWDAEIAATVLDEDGWRNVGQGLPTARKFWRRIFGPFGGDRRRPPTAISCRRRSGPASGWTPISFSRSARRCASRALTF